MDLSRAQLLFFHGWGFDASCWKYLQASLPPCASLDSFDRGYWGRALVPEWRPESAGKIVLCHSLGLHFVPEALLQEADLVVIISGFLFFHQQAGRGQLTVKHLQRMGQRLQSEPQRLLDDFYQDCAYPEAAQDIAGAELSLLAQDLRLLDGHEYGTETLCAKNVLILHGVNDRIVSPAKAHEMHERLAGSSLVLCGDAGHGLPFTHPDFVSQAIIDYLVSSS